MRAAGGGTECVRRLDPDGVLLGKGPSRVPDDVLLSIYRTMSLVRSLDDRMLKLQRQGRIAFYGQAIGQEAGSVASAAALEDRDWLFPALR
ncbi:MAG: thiamine pyrophosphate-dependent enzyme, partial [Planctomycetota bacterium]|nr:thiamine pyrophosphate-dependent enzyme [Planctomycetota bacterium]